MTLATFALVALLAANSPHGGHEASDAAVDASEDSWVKALLAEMRTTGSPRERALFAWTGADEVAADEALRAAAQSAPADVLVQMFRSSNGGDPQAWSRLEPSNGLAWIPLLEELPGDGEETDAAIARIASATDYDDHFTEAWLAYDRAIRARAMPPAVAAKMGQGDGENASEIMAMAYAAALPLKIAPILRACKRAQHPDAPAARFEDCARIGRGILNSESSVLSKRVGGSLVRASGLEGDADREARRALDWLLQASMELLDEKKHPGELKAYFADLASTSSETRAMELLRARHGVPIQPPADWASKW